MTPKKKLYIQRLYLAIFGLLLSVLTVEIVLRLYVSVLNEQKTYTFNKEAVYRIAKEQKEHASGYLRNDTQEEYASQSKPLGTIYALGDSFTNGGNLDFSASYPYQLHQSLEEKWTIHNMGVCESSSIDAQNTVTKLMGEGVEPGSLFLILTGATDIFAGHNQSKDTMATPLIQIQKKQRMDQYSYPSFLNHFKSFLLLKELTTQYLWVHSNQQLSSDLFIVQKLNQISKSSSYQLCLAAHSDGFCLAHEMDEPMAKDAREYVLEYLLKLDLGMDSKDYAQRIRSLLDYLKVHGGTLEEFAWVDTVATLSFLASKQSQLSLQSIVDELRATFNQFPHPHKDDHLFLQAISNLAEAMANREVLLEQRKERIRKIVVDLQEHKMKPILMTYPLAYSEVNQSIREVAKQLGVHLIDLQSIFEKSQKSQKEKLLVDYQHLTKKGNQIVAESIRNYLNENNLSKMGPSK